MTKRNKLIYWISTIWLSLGMLSSGIVQLFKMKGDVEFILRLGYPAYFLTILGFWKILGVIVLLMPRYPLWKEWAYAGFFFTMSGAIFSHLALANPASDVLPPVLLLVLTVVSWYSRPVERRILSVNVNQ